MGTEQILLFSVPVTGPLAVDPDLPVAQFVTMALATEAVGFGKRNHFSGDQAQAVSILQIVTVKAPALTFRMIKDDVIMHIDQFPALRVRLHVSMAVRTWEDVFRKGWGRHWIGETLFRKALVLFDLLLNDQVARAVEKFFGCCLNVEGTQGQQAEECTKRPQKMMVHGSLLQKLNYERLQIKRGFIIIMMCFICQYSFRVSVSYLEVHEFRFIVCCSKQRQSLDPLRDAFFICCAGGLS